MVNLKDVFKNVLRVALNYRKVIIQANSNALAYTPCRKQNVRNA